VAHATVHTVELPCVFGRALQVLDEALAAHSPVFVLALGLAAGRGEISVERAALNIDDARIPDNAGAQPVDVPVVAGGPAAWFSTLPVKAIVAALRQAGLPAGVRSGFVHVPLLDTQAAAHPGLPTLPLADLVRGVRMALEVGLTHVGADARVPGGAIA
jgi:pyroglutamyl-peptidase